MVNTQQAQTVICTNRQPKFLMHLTPRRGQRRLARIDRASRHFEGSAVRRGEQQDPALR